MPKQKVPKIRETTWSKIESALISMVSRQPDDFRLKMKTLERESGVSRTTLYSKEVQRKIKDFIALRPNANLRKRRQNAELEEENKKLKLEISNLRDKNKILLSDYIKLFESMYGGSAVTKPPLRIIED